MPEPLHMPPKVTVFPLISKVTAISFSTVSVVMMALAASVPPSRVWDFAAASFRMPSVILSTGICLPMTPVEATRTDSAGMPSSSAAHLHSASQQSSPSFPVQALAMPELATTA